MAAPPAPKLLRSRLMLGLRLDEASLERKLRVLALGAHADDIEIGCGGTLLRLAGETAGAEILWVVLTGDERRAREATSSANAFTQGFAASEVGLWRVPRWLLALQRRGRQGLLRGAESEVWSQT